MRQPGQVAFTLTAAMRRALHATKNGQVQRTYYANSSLLKGPPGVSSRTLWILANHRLIEEEPRTGITCNMRLSRAGIAAMGK